MSATQTSDIVTAAVLVIGDEILSGRTKDKNIGYIADHLTAIGIQLHEVRIVPDIEADIVAAVNALRARYTYLFTTGGIGPTHDDITSDCVAKAFGVPIDVDPRALALMKPHYEKRGLELTPARLRMARLPRGLRTRREQGLGRAGLHDRQRHRHGRHSQRHAGHARCRHAASQDRQEDAVARRSSCCGPRARSPNPSAPIRRSSRMSRWAPIPSRRDCADLRHQPRAALDRSRSPRGRSRGLKDEARGEGIVSLSQSQPVRKISRNRRNAFLGHIEAPVQALTMDLARGALGPIGKRALAAFLERFRGHLQGSATSDCINQPAGTNLALSPPRSALPGPPRPRRASDGLVGMTTPAIRPPARGKRWA